MQAADLILRNGRFFTLSAAAPRVSALAISGGRIIAIGGDGEVAAFRAPQTEEIDLGGRVVIPGLTDSHIHLILYGVSALVWCDLAGSRSIDEIVRRLRAHAPSRSCEWILGRGFDQEILAERRFPTREDLDLVSRERPVLVSRLCGHACVANSRAIELAGPGRLPESGRESGLLTEDDMDPLWEKIPDPTPDQRIEAALFAAEQARAAGITAVHCLIGSMDDLTALRQLHADDRLLIRFYVQVPYSIFPSLAEEGLKTGDGDDMLRIGSVKMFADGSMGARTAALKQDYSDGPGNRGILLHSQQELTEMVRKVHRAGWQAAIHAIGDLAVGTAVNAIETVLAETEESNVSRRHRIEHASILSAELIAKMARLKIVAAVQPQFIITDFWTAERVGPERCRWAYPFRTMMQAGVPMALGSDCPVESLDAFQLIHRAVTRDERSPQERLTVEETIQLYAVGGAHASFEEASRGTLEPGKLADMVVLDADIFGIPPSDILSCRPYLVLVSGRV